MHMGSGFCLCAGADFLSARGVGGGVPDAPRADSPYGVAVVQAAWEG